MTEHAQDGSMQPDAPRPKGEYKMMVLLFVLCGALFVDSLRSPGIFQGESAGPGSIPQLVTGALLLMLIGLAMQFLRRRYKEGTFGELIHHLFDKEVVILLVLLIVYGLVVETVHFIPATFVFLVGTMFLLERKKFVLKIIVSAATLAGLYLIFSTLFQVVLP
jgi:putative tricarboxylic transport membrane protein